jgi:hypothetical protein
MFHPISRFKKFRQEMPLLGKIIVAVIILTIILIALVVSGFASLRLFDFTQKNPKFCASCHLMKDAFQVWEKSEHRNVNCHDCHHLSVIEANMLFIHVILHSPTSVTPRHGKVIVGWDFCMKCHWNRDERFPKAPNINASNLHARHVFVQQIQCSNCHGYVLHEFLPEERLCVKCHEDRTVHGAGMEKLACLNCHSDTTKGLEPERKKCLYCHGPEEVRRELIKQGSLDVRYTFISEDTINKSTKIDITKDAPMQFPCSDCHNPHGNVKPESGDCLKCHKEIPSSGRHQIHVQVSGMKCLECHKPHYWGLKPADAKAECSKCHQYRDPKGFVVR